MNQPTDSTPRSGKVEAYKVSRDARMSTLPRHFGIHMLTVEAKIYDLLRQFAKAYGGGEWTFYELSNGGFFMTPPEGTYRLFVPGNGYEGEMSAEAAGIAVCLFCFSLLSFENRRTEMFSNHFHWLRDYAVIHPEAAKIFAAID
jgi:hypothetical protein